MSPDGTVLKAECTALIDTLNRGGTNIRDRVFFKPLYWCPLCSKNKDAPEFMFLLMQISFQLLYFNPYVSVNGKIPTCFLWLLSSRVID